MADAAAASDIDTPRGPARAHVDGPAQPRALLVLGHGAGGGVDAPDLRAVTDAALELGMRVARVEQPYRVAGRRAPDRAPALDAAWTAAVDALRADAPGVPLVVGGRSSGARVACRTALAVGAAGVLCLAFPVEGRRRRDGTAPPSRLAELDGAGVPALVIQGDRDPFGMPPPGDGRDVVVVRGDHSLRASVPGLRAAARAWLEAIAAPA